MFLVLLLVLGWRGGLLSGSSREVVGVDVGCRMVSRSPAVGIVLDLLSQLSRSLSSTNGVFSSILFGDSASFIELHVGNVTVMINLGVNLLLIVDVSIWSSEDKDGAKESQAPEWKVLDQEIGKERGNKGSNSCEKVFNKHDPLEFDDDKVQEIVDLFKNAFQVLPGDRVIASRPHLANNSLVSKRFAGILQSSNRSEQQISCLENISHDIDETEGKDSTEKRGENNT